MASTKMIHVSYISLTVWHGYGWSVTHPNWESETIHLISSGPYRSKNKWKIEKLSEKQLLFYHNVNIEF